MSNLITLVRPLRREQIRRVTKNLRYITGIQNVPNYCVAHWTECKFLPLSDFEFLVEDMRFMGENHGLTSHKDRAIIIREDVYERACEGCGRDRMTIIHEVGHTCLHAPENVEFARSFDGPIPAFRSAEWQAKAFAAELIVPHDLLESGMRVSDVAETFGVSSEAASYQLKVYQREGLIKLDGSFDENDPSIVWVKSSV